MLRSNENYAELKPMYPLLIQQFVDDYDLMHGIALISAQVPVGSAWN